MKAPQKIQWSRRYETGIQEVDQQHQQLFEILNRLVEARRGLVGEHELEELIYELLNYTQYHFSTEEELFRELPIYREHKRQHLKFTIAIMKFNILFLEGKSHLDTNILVFLIQWLRKHVLETDLATFRQLSSRAETTNEKGGAA